MTHTKESFHERKPVVGITHGDYNGINYEIIIKALMDNRILDFFTPVIYGSSKIASYYRKALNANEFNINLVKKAENAGTKRQNIVNVTDQEVKIDVGESTPLAGKLALDALEMAVQDLKNQHIDVLVTAPINKKNIQSDKFQFRGHTEYLAQKFNADNYLMMMIARNLRMGFVTGHTPINQVAQVINPDLIVKKLIVMNNSLIRDFGISKPKIALLSLNPHAGDEGVIGQEESEIIMPAIQKAFKENILSYGPFPADGFFGSLKYNQFDGVMAMYHDQGMIPFKLIAFDEGVNFTAGLSIVRTSPAHGTAYQLAGKNTATPDSFRNALFLACEIFHNRKSFDGMTSNSLKIGTYKPTEEEDQANN